MNKRTNYYGTKFDVNKRYMCNTWENVRWLEERFNIELLAEAGYGGTLIEIDIESKRVAIPMDSQFLYQDTPDVYDKVEMEKILDGA